MPILEVPLLEDGEVLTVNLETDLPEDPIEICTLLENENCAIEYWLAFSAAYARINQFPSAFEVISKGLEAPIAQTQDSKQPFYACLAWLNLSKLRKADPAEKQQALAEAQENAQKAYELNRADPATLLARTMLSLFGGNIEGMLAPLQAASAVTGKRNIYTLFAQARLLYHRGNFRDALKIYQGILRDQPSIELRPDPRIGIGLCYWKLGDYDHALLAWNRALDIEPKSTAVNSMLGIYYLHQALERSSVDDFETNYRKAIDFMQDAYNGDGAEHALASVTIASYLFARQNMDYVLTLAEKAIETATAPKLISDAWFWKGRVFHFRADYDQALEAYRKAVEANGNNLPAVIGKGMVELLSDNQEAVHTLESAMTRNPKNAYAALLCGISHFMRTGNDQKRIQKTISILEKYVSLVKSPAEKVQPEALLALSSLYERTKQMPPTRALEYMQQAIAAITDEGASDKPLDASLYNNRAVLAYYCGKYEEARAGFNHALEAPDASGLEPTIAFNLARLDDATGSPDKARAGYDKILETFPAYADAQIRKAFLQVALGSPEESEDAMSVLLDTQDKNLEARALQSWFLRRKIRGGKKVENEEQSHLKSTLMEVDKHDSYSLIAMGNLYLLNAREIRATKEADVLRRDKAYYKASEFFDKALQIDPANAYAAQGVAIILAETKRTRQALQILDHACETIQDASVYLNIGHCLMDLKDYNKAIEMYSVALDRSAGMDATLFTLLGRAWYASGSAEKDVSGLEKALDYSNQALEMHSSSIPLQFNVAFLRFQIADMVRRLPDQKRTVKMIEDAHAGLKIAIESLKEISTAKNPPFKPADLEARAETGTNTILPQLEGALETQREFEDKAKKKLEEARKVRTEERQRVEAELKRKREEDEERERELEKERALLQEQATQWEEQRAVERAASVSAEREPKKRRKTKKKDEDEDEPMLSDPESEHSDHPENGTHSRHNVISDDESEPDVANGKEDEDLDELF